jgi:hypothetical protein
VGKFRKLAKSQENPALEIRGKYGKELEKLLSFALPKPFPGKH